MRTSFRPNFKHSLLLGTSIATMALAAPALAQNATGQETVIVTGTRVQGMTAADSAAPITVLGTDALTKGTGSTDLRQALGQTVPSFTAQQFGGDTANLTLSAALRGLSPNDTLVLVNGHRRHYTGNLHVDAGGFAAGSSSADLSFIPEAAIDHVEVLLDGAAAQYGTDAIAGVVNIILKKKSSGGQLSATAGNYYNRGGRSPGDNGESYDLSYNMGLPLFDHGYVNFTVEKSFSNFTQYGQGDARLINAQGNPVAQQTVTSINATTGIANLSGGNGIPNSFLPGVIGYPRANSIDGNPEVQSTMGEFNSAYDFSDIRGALCLRHLWPQIRQIVRKLPPAEPDHRHHGLRPALQRQQSGRLCGRFQHGERPSPGRLGGAVRSRSPVRLPLRAARAPASVPRAPSSRRASRAISSARTSSMPRLVPPCRRRPARAP